MAGGDVAVLRGLLAPEEVAATQRRAADSRDRVLPEPVERGHYPPWPWPIV